MTSNPAPDVRNVDGFARDFGTADGERVMVAVITRQQFADLARATRLVRTSLAGGILAFGGRAAAPQRRGVEAWAVSVRIVEPGRWLLGASSRAGRESR
jgi:hypothetical protein